MSKVLIVDDEPDILEFVSYNLEKEGLEVSTAADGQTGIEMAKKVDPDLIILDVMMPKMDGIEVCSELRKLPRFKDTLIAFLSARGENYSQLAGFEAGGDEYITKPIKPQLLIARVKALLRRTPSAFFANNGRSKKHIHIDKEKMLVFKGDQPIQLPKMEFNLLCLLTSKPGKVFPREHIYQKLWGNDLRVSDRTIDVHIRKLREKVGKDFIKTVVGVGYKYDELY